MLTRMNDYLSTSNGQNNFTGIVIKISHRRVKSSRRLVQNNKEDMDMKAVLFVGHGSRLEAGNEEVRTFVKRMTPLMDPRLIVETCFLEFASPTISQGIDTCVKKGADEVVVIPIILLHAGHSKLHI